MIRLILPSKKYIKGSIAAIREQYKKKEISLKELNDEIQKRKNVSIFLKKLKDLKNEVNLEKVKLPKQYTG